MASRRTSLMIYLLIPLLLYAVICLALYCQQDSMVFVPSHDSAQNLEREASSVGFKPWLNAQGERIGWESKAGDARNVLLVCHGNGGYALNRSYYLDYSRGAGGWKTYLLEYPGYGAREGRPSEPSVTAAALDALDTLSANPACKIWLVGESLGSGVVCALANRRPEKVAGLALVTPFNSLASAASWHYPWLPVSLLLKTRFDSEKNLKTYPGPVAFVISQNDSVVPSPLGLKLHEGYPGKKRLWTVSDSGHNVTPFLSQNWPEIASWLQDGKSTP